MPRVERAVEPGPGRRPRGQRGRQVGHLDPVVGFQLAGLPQGGVRFGDGIGVLLQVAAARRRDDLGGVGGLWRSVDVDVDRLADGVDVVGVGGHVAQADDVVVMSRFRQAVGVVVGLRRVDGGFVAAGTRVPMAEEVVVAALARLVGMVAGLLRVGRRRRHGGRGPGSHLRQAANKNSFDADTNQQVHNPKTVRV